VLPQAVRDACRHDPQEIVKSKSYSASIAWLPAEDDSSSTGAAAAAECGSSSKQHLNGAASRASAPQELPGSIGSAAAAAAAGGSSGDGAQQGAFISLQDFPPGKASSFDSNREKQGKLIRIQKTLDSCRLDWSDLELEWIHHSAGGSVLAKQTSTMLQNACERPEHACSWRKAARVAGPCLYLAACTCTSTYTSALTCNHTYFLIFLQGRTCRCSPS
jgi:hypothetical protein